MDLYGPALISIYFVKYFLLLQILDFFCNAILILLFLVPCDCKYWPDAVGAGCYILAGVPIIRYQRELCCVGIIPEPVIPTGILFPTI